MKKIELVYNEILEKFENNRNKLTSQAEIARTLSISLSTVNHALAPLKRMGAIRIKKNGFEIVNAKKILYLWASIRNLEKDIIFKTRVEKTVTDIEKNMPSDILFGAYSAFKYKFKDAPADYSEVYIYADNLNEIKKRFNSNNDRPNLFVLKKEIKKITLALIFVDLWNLKEWYAKDFILNFEKNLGV